MRYLVDECLGQSMVSQLRDRGNDVAWVREVASGMSDEDVLAWSFRDERVLITEDFDYGQLIYERDLEAYGVVIVRLSAFAGSWIEVVSTVVGLLEKAQRKLAGNLTIIGSTRIKSRPLPAQ